MSPHLPSFDRRLRQLREARGLTVPELAERAGVHRVNLYRLERGERGLPATSTLLRLCQALDVSLDELLGQAKPKKSAKSG